MLLGPAKSSGLALQHRRARRDDDYCSAKAAASLTCGPLMLHHPIDVCLGCSVNLWYG